MSRKPQRSDNQFNNGGESIPYGSTKKAANPAAFSILRFSSTNSALESPRKGNSVSQKSPKRGRRRDPDMHKYSRKLILRDDYIRKDGTAAVYLQVIINRKRKIFPIGLLLRPEEWDPERQQIRSKSSGRLDKFEIRDWNIYMQNILGKASSIFLNARITDNLLTVQEFTKQFVDVSKRMDFHAFLQKEIERQKEIKNRTSILNYNNTWSKLKAFAPELSMKDLNWDLIDRWNVWLKVDDKQSQNSVWRHNRNLKYFINQAIRRGIEISNPYKTFKYSASKSERVFLTLPEVHRLQDYYNSSIAPDNHKKVLRYFLFSCYTSLRISDLSVISMDNMIDNYLTFQPVKTAKTGKIVRIPIIESALQFVHNELGKLFDTYTGQRSNKVLKEICKNTGIKKHVTMHTGRHTFAMMYLAAGGTVTELKKIMGHSTINTTMVYVHILDEQVKAGMVKLNDYVSSSKQEMRSK